MKDKDEASVRLVISIPAQFMQLSKLMQRQKGSALVVLNPSACIRLIGSA